MKKFFFTLTAFVFSSFFFSCMHSPEVGEGCSANYEVYTYSVSLPDSVPVGTTADIQVVYRPYSYCTKFEKFSDAKYGDTTYISVYGFEDECICNEFPDTMAVYTFNGFAKRTLFFRFLYSNDSIIEDSIVVY